MTSGIRIFRFGAFELRPRTKELYRSGVRLKLRPQPFQVLEILLQNPGEVISRDDLHKRLWPSDTFVDFEHGLNSSVKDLRAVLGDSAQEPRYIETLYKVGYRFVAPVEVEREVAHEPNPSPQPTTPVITVSEESRKEASGVHAESTVLASAATGHAFFRRHATVWFSLGAIAVIAVIAAATHHWPTSKTQRSSISGHLRLAVLPFENQTNDSGQNFVTDGLTDEIIARLGRVDPEHLSVIARTSVMRLEPSLDPLDNAGRELGVQYVLRGSVRRDGGQLHIATELLHLPDKTRLWSHEYARSEGSLLEIQEEIGQETADAILLALGESKWSEPSRLATLSNHSNSDAYLHYLKGRFFWNQRNEKGFELAIREFQSAIDKDPKYAQAYAGLADAYNLSSSYGLLSPKEFMPKARAAALRALELDDTLAEAHTSLASIAQSFDWDWPTAEKEYRRAIELNANYATAHHWLAECLALQGRFDESFEEIAKARELDPLSLIIAADYGSILYFSRQYGAAIAQFHAVLEMDSTFPRAHMITYAYVQEGRFPEALEVVEKWNTEQHAAWARPMMAYVYGRWGKRQEAQNTLDEMLRQNPQTKMEAAAMVLLNIGEGNNKEALDWLEKARDERAAAITAIKVDPIYDPIRNEPRFHAVLKQLNLEK
jgi:TolB-like protein/DNA-binding winged helix-turn-helix (wHTH) protein/Tfp pilus assembly protein PilF